MKIDFIFNTQIRENIVNLTINKWLEFLRKYIYPGKSLKSLK